MASQVKGRCPCCPYPGKVMQGTRRIYWVGTKPNALDFPYEVYHCPNHGAFIWRRNRHQLADFSKLHREATISGLDEEMRERVRWCGYTIVKLKCPYCNEEWEQHKEFPPKSWGRIVCPNGHLIPRARLVGRKGGKLYAE